MRSLMITFIAAFSAGCASQEHKLDKAYAPLARIVERPNICPNTCPSESTVRTVGDTAYVADLDRWLIENPPGSLTYRAVLLHEQKHALRQIDRGVIYWLAAYATDPEFMWREEQHGWYLELTTLQSGGASILVGDVVDSLVRHVTVTGEPMVSHMEALNWVQAVLDGRWIPPSD